MHRHLKIHTIAVFSSRALPNKKEQKAPAKLALHICGAERCRRPPRKKTPEQRIAETDDPAQIRLNQLYAQVSGIIKREMGLLGNLMRKLCAERNAIQSTQFGRRSHTALKQLFGAARGTDMRRKALRYRYRIAHQGVSHTFINTARYFELEKKHTFSDRRFLIAEREYQRVTSFQRNWFFPNWFSEPAPPKKDSEGENPNAAGSGLFQRNDEDSLESSAPCIPDGPDPEGNGGPTSPASDDDDDDDDEDDEENDGEGQPDQDSSET